MEKNFNTKFPVDAVITWVDGNDEKFQEKINNYAKIKIDWSNKKETIRYNSIEEIGIAIQSIINFAPFIRNIFLVTDNQTPNCYKQLKEFNKESSVNLEIIDHKIIFDSFEEYLPTFNSCSIGTMLFRIPNLAEHFIYFNDDTFLMRETKVEDFFRNGFPVVRGKWEKFYEDQRIRKIYTKVVSLFKKTKAVELPGYKKAQQKSAKLLGLKKYVRRDHTPVAIRKSTVENFFNKNPEIFKNNIQFRFRNENQFIISSLSNHLEIKKNTYYLEENFQLVYFQSYQSLLKIKFKLWWFEVNPKKIFMCCQNLEIANDDGIKLFFNWFNKRLAKK